MASTEFALRQLRSIALIGSLVGVIAVVDYSTETEYRIFPLYYLPVALGSWHAGRVAAIVLALLSATAWLYSNQLAGTHYSSTMVVVFNVAMQTVGAATVGLLIAELRRRLERERYLSRQDALTSLPNRRAFLESGELLLAGAARYGRPLCLAYLDLDNFKLVNDGRGHAEGDGVLCAVAAILRDHTRSSDLVARLGGDEFAIMLVETDADAAAAQMGRIKGLVDAAMRRNGWPVTASIGIVRIVPRLRTLEEAIRDADAAMYAAKLGGQNPALTAEEDTVGKRTGSA